MNTAKDWLRLLYDRFRFRGLTFVEADGVYRADFRGQSWHVPTTDRAQAVWAMQFMHRGERYIECLRESDVVYEVGATSGEYTIPAAQVIGSHGMLHAFEANPLAYQSLLKNIDLHHLTNVRATNKAVSSESGKKMAFHFRNRIMTGLAPAPQHNNDRDGAEPSDESSFRTVMTQWNQRDYQDDVMSVETISLDDYARDGKLPKPNVIKATVNGHELEVFKGATELLPSARNIIFQSPKHAEIIQYLSKHGFQVMSTFDVGARSELAVLMERRK